MMEIVFLFTILSPLGILFHCSSSNKTKLTKNEELIIQTNTIGNLKIVQIDRQEYLNLSDFKTYKRVELHNINSQEKHIFDLSPIINSGYQIGNIEFLSLDSILILTKYQNKIILSNKSGDYLTVYDYSSLKQIKNRFELMPFGKSFLLNDSTFLFSLEYQNDEDTNYYKTRLIENRLLKVENFSKSNSNITLGLKNLYSHFSDETDLTIEGNNFYYLNNNILFFSAYSDTLYNVNPNTLKIINKTKMHSNYSNLCIKPVKIKDQIAGTKDLNKNFKSNGQIRNIFYDVNKKIYYLFVSHKPTKKKNPWSIIILDIDFNKVNETKMDETKYSRQGVMTSKGLLISNYPQYKNDKNAFEKISFSIFNYE